MITLHRYLMIGVAGLSMAGALALPATAAAAGSQSFQISPPEQEIIASPGTSVRNTIKVTNLTDQDLTLQIDKKNFAAKGEDGQVDLVDQADPLYSLDQYFQLSTPTLVVPAKLTKDVEYTLNVPVGAEPGGRYGSLVFHTIAAKLPNGQSGAAVRQDLASLIFLRVSGQANEQVKIASFAPEKSFYEYGPVTFLTRIQNLGNVHEKPTGDIVVKDMFGFKTATVPLDAKNVIPGAIRRSTADLKKHLLFGRYTATLTLKNGTTQTLTAQAAFTVIPYKLIAFIIIILAVIFFVFFRGRKRFARAARILAGKD